MNRSRREHRVGDECLKTLAVPKRPSRRFPGRRTGVRCGGAEGFTLMEALVAISVLAISLVVILQLFAGGLRASRLSDDYTRGILHAREKMESTLLDSELSEGVREGDFGDGYRWRSEIRRVAMEEDEEGRLPFDMYRATVAVEWKAGEKDKHFAVTTLRLTEKRKGP